ncbi:MAG: (d)CMP kinase [Lachnospiraceae bacterium]|nr:(d)CMP kinase [Lachnospiraceae bacterium]
MMKIAIDGPAGAGKSTIAKKVAREIGAIYVDTGAMYRAMGIFMLKKGISAEDGEAIAEASREADISIIYKDGGQHVILNGEDVTGDLRHEEVGAMASCVAKHGAVRAKLVDLQRAMAQKSSVVMDGRDIGTVVLPDAELKIYLDASADVRAKRRFLELEEKGEDHDTLDAIRADIVARDEQDKNREISPLIQADDAVYLDTSDLTIDQVTEKICELARKRSEKEAKF